MSLKSVSDEWFEVISCLAFYCKIECWYWLKLLLLKVFLLLSISALVSWNKINILRFLFGLYSQDI